MTCKDCKFYTSESEQGGFCRRYPPQMVSENKSQLPGVKAEWWCGEYKAPSKSKR